MSKSGLSPALSFPLMATPHLSSSTPPRWGVASRDQLCRVSEPWQKNIYIKHKKYLTKIQFGTHLKRFDDSEFVRQPEAPRSEAELAGVPALVEGVGEGSGPLPGPRPLALHPVRQVPEIFLTTRDGSGGVESFGPKVITEMFLRVIKYKIDPKIFKFTKNVC